MRRALAALAALTALPGVTLAASADAAPTYVTRPITLPKHVFAADLGLGLGHVSTRPRDFTGAGINLDGAFAVTERVELGLRAGLRMGDEGKVTQADTYGRTLWTETYGTRFDTFANPEVRVRWAAYAGDVVEVGLDGRVILPVEEDSRAGVMFGVPLAFHIGRSARIDTGPYVTTLFYDRTAWVFSLPGYFWFQVGDRFWLGPMLSVRHFDYGGGGLGSQTRDDLLLGVGFGYQVASAVDLKWMWLFPAINQDRGATNFGAGFGVQIRAE